MVASSVGRDTKAFQSEPVGNASYLQRHNRQMFEEGRSFSGNERDKLFFNTPGLRFEDLSDLSGCDSPNDGRAVIAADFDDDGDVDLFVHELQRERHALYRNDLGVKFGGFVKVRLSATTGQHEAIGATVVARTPAGRVAQVLSRGSGFSSCLPPELVFGIGDFEATELEVLWPGGRAERFGSVPRGTRVLLVEGEGRPRFLQPKPLPLPDPLPLGLRVGLGARLPVFRAHDSEGRETLVDLRRLAGGKRLLLNFWASYCAPCVSELPQLQQLDATGEYAVVGLSMDAPADLDDANELFTRRGARFPTFFLGASAREEDEAGETAQVGDLVDLARLPLPTTLVLSPDGVIEGVLRGPVSAPQAIFGEVGSLERRR